MRSFLGLAGDCAIASIVNRGATETILDLGVAVRRIGDPELDDVVVKSGRTTAVTYGVVTRVHTITKLVYGSQGEQRIGGFEIGIDSRVPGHARRARRADGARLRAAHAADTMPPAPEAIGVSNVRRIEARSEIAGSRL